MCEFDGPAVYRGIQPVSHIRHRRRSCAAAESEALSLDRLRMEQLMQRIRVVRCPFSMRCTMQLGLKLEMQKHPLPVLVSDHIDEKPTEN